MEPESSRRILYAEDDYANRRLVELQLKRKNWDCMSVDSGEAAVAALNSGIFQAVILDYNMPGMSGVQTFAQIRKMNKTIPILALTSDDTLTQELLDAGFFRVIIKPLLDDRLLSALEDAAGL